MKKEQMIVKIDSRNRITIPKSLTDELIGLYKIYTQNGKIILDPIQEIPEREKWLFDPKNKEIVQRLKKALQDPTAIDFDEFKKGLPLTTQSKTKKK